MVGRGGSVVDETQSAIGNMLTGGNTNTSALVTNTMMFDSDYFSTANTIVDDDMVESITREKVLYTITT